MESLLQTTAESQSLSPSQFEMLLAQIDRVTNTELLNGAKILRILIQFQQHRLRWLGHVHRIPDRKLNNNNKKNTRITSSSLEGRLQERYEVKRSGEIGGGRKRLPVLEIITVNQDESRRVTEFCRQRKVQQMKGKTSSTDKFSHYMPECHALVGL